MGFVDNEKADQHQPCPFQIAHVKLMLFFNRRHRFATLQTFASQKKQSPRSLTSPVTDVLSHSWPSTFDRCTLQFLWAENIVCLRVYACVCVFECVLKLKVKTRQIWFKGVCAKGWISQCISLQWRLHQGCVTIQSSPLTFFVWVQTTGRGKEMSKGDL